MTDIDIGAGMAAKPPADAQEGPAIPVRKASLLIIGGHEDRENAREVLARFVELSGGPGCNIVVITAASTVPEKMWEPYETSFNVLGAATCRHIAAESRADAENEEQARAVAGADGIFISGGDQKRLLSCIGGTALERAIHTARAQRGACLAGTSAGASAMSALMVADGRADLLPEKGAVSLGAGLGLLQRVVIDQHFSERHRLARLLSVVAQNPHLYGIGIDENTALQVTPGVGIEVIGDGAVTVLDGHAMATNIADIRRRATPEMIGVLLHLLPAGSSHTLEQAPPALTDFLHNLITRSTPA